MEDLVQKLERVYRYKKLRQRLSSNGRKVLQAYEQDKVLGRVLELYYRVVGEQ